MSEQSPVKNLCLFSVLAFVLLASGSLQAAFDCLEQIGHRHQPAVHVTDCHLVVPQPETDNSCPNRSCHQAAPTNHSLGDPILAGLHDHLEPLLGGSRQPLPSLRGGSPLPEQRYHPQPLFATSWQVPPFTPQRLLSVRTTVLLN